MQDIRDLRLSDYIKERGSGRYYRPVCDKCMEPELPRSLGKFCGLGGRAAAAWSDVRASSYSGEISDMFDDETSSPLILRVAFSNASSMHDGDDVGPLLQRQRTRGLQLDAANLTWLSVWPARQEWVFPPLTRLQPAHNWGLFKVHMAGHGAVPGGQDPGAPSRTAFFIDCKAAVEGS